MDAALSRRRSWVQIPSGPLFNGAMVKLAIMSDLHSVVLGSYPGSSTIFGRVVKPVDTQDLNSCEHYARAGSIPASATIRGL